MVDESQWRLFFEQLQDGKTVDLAAAKIGKSRSWLYRLRNDNPDIAQRWDDALVAGREVRADELEAIAEERARKRSDTLLIFMLKSLRPERFSDSFRRAHGLEQVLRIEDIPGYQELCDGLLKALQPHPEALAAVVGLLGELKAKNEAPPAQVH